jgi:hypothetical protein
MSLLQESTPIAAIACSRSNLRFNALKIAFYTDAFGVALDAKLRQLANIARHNLPHLPKREKPNVATGNAYLLLTMRWKFRTIPNVRQST